MSQVKRSTKLDLPHTGRERHSTVLSVEQWVIFFIECSTHMWVCETIAVLKDESQVFGPFDA